MGTSTIHPPAEFLRRELEIGRHLADAGAPIAPPTDELPPGPHVEAGLILTFWRYYEHRAAAETDAVAAGTALRELHAALDSYPRALPPFTDHFDAAGASLASAELPGLRPIDRAFLRETYERLNGRLLGIEMDARRLHGGPHLGNVLATRDGVRLIDFEAACTGPVEWDAGFLPPPGAREVAQLDAGLMRLLDDVRSLCVSVWCWMQPERAPEVAEAAAVHLALLRRRASRS